MRKSFYTSGSANYALSLKVAVLLIMLIFTILPAQEMNGFQIMEKALNKSSWKDQED